MKKRAMILAAGLGTRLMPLTKDKPKALVEYNGKTLIEIILRRLIHHGFRDIIINLYHHPDKIISFLESKKNFGANIIYSDESEMLLDTGGGIKKASPLFEGEPVLIHNVDVYTDLNLDDFYNFHNDYEHFATLAVKDRETTRPFLVNDAGILCGWENLVSGERKIIRQEYPLQQIAYSGIAMLSSTFIDLLPQSGSYSLTPELLNIAENHDVHLFPHTGVWKDMGKPEAFF
jgi:N-acetyl-alpha-D-muramate 1-phosphate uridylyltransferase